MEKKFRRLGTIWLLLKNLLTLFVVFGAFSVAETSFETIVVAGLVLTILNIDGFFRFWAMARLEDKTPSKEDKEAFDQYVFEKEKAESRGLISMVFSYVVYLITIFVIITTALG